MAVSSNCLDEISNEGIFSTTSETLPLPPPTSADKLKLSLVEGILT